MNELICGQRKQRYRLGNIRVLLAMGGAMGLICTINQTINGAVWGNVLRSKTDTETWHPVFGSCFKLVKLYSKWTPSTKCPVHLVNWSLFSRISYGTHAKPGFTIYTPTYPTPIVSLIVPSWTCNCWYHEFVFIYFLPQAVIYVY